jgi:hypothetical protein
MGTPSRALLSISTSEKTSHPGTGAKLLVRTWLRTMGIWIGKLEEARASGSRIEHTWARLLRGSAQPLCVCVDGQVVVLANDEGLVVVQHMRRLHDSRRLL